MLPHPIVSYRYRPRQTRPHSLPRSGYANRMREWWALLQADCAGRLRGYAAPLLGDLAQAVACAFLFMVIAPLGGQDGGPYWVFLLAGLAPWFYYENALLGCANACFSYAPLIRQNLCRPALLPPVRTAAALLHALPWFLAAAVGAGAAGVLSPRWWYLLPYCLLAGTMQGVAEGYFAAMFAPFFGRFVAQGMRLTLSLFFWITPVAWPAARLNGANAMMALSPIHYVVDTARAAVLAGAPFPAWNRTLWFWCLMIGLAIAGAAGCSRLHEPYREVL